VYADISEDTPEQKLVIVVFRLFWLLQRFIKSLTEHDDIIMREFLHWLAGIVVADRVESIQAVYVAVFDNIECICKHELLFKCKMSIPDNQVAFPVDTLNSGIKKILYSAFIGLSYAIF